MKTEVLMKRELFGNQIKQKSKTEFFSATDLLRAGNKYRAKKDLYPIVLSSWLRSEKVQEFIKTLKAEFGEIYLPARGRGKDTWIHPYLFIDLALAIDPYLKIKVYGWLYDHLLKYRNKSGDSYKKMVGAIDSLTTNKTQLQKNIKHISNRIRRVCGLSYSDKWEKVSQEILELRDKIHEQIFGLSNVVRDIDTLVTVAIDSAQKLNKE